ncbi:hypothetical protein BX286_6253 [Streptomyces sp. 3211.6]|uniref:hypothetical protein n=1 Tax=Streptomyces sp. 3211.6 TaxID=1938845 RepID=UPI000EB13DD4|nr:hypothetical protein [Streptomyces sp. 3211.6]RKT08169.1 hypothetical protein BX286_6253 [Streptomyces sp. 3211.6]
MAGTLHIRVAPGDNGSRPFNSCANAWTNESIWLDPPRPDNTTAEVDQPSVIKVQVRNTGATDLPFVKVHAYVMDPQIGLSSPAQRIAEFVSSAQTVPSVTRAPNGVVFACGPWTPTAAQLSASNGGHLCLFANAFQDRNLADPPYDGKDLTPGVDTFQICADAHQGQRNITLWAVARGMERLSTMGFRVNPLPKDVEEAVLAVVTLKEAELVAPGLQSVLLSRRDITRDKENRLVIDTGEGEPVPLRLSEKPLTFELETDGGHRGRPYLPLDRDNHHRHTRAKLEVGLDPNDPIGTVHAFDLVQHTKQGRHLGGIRVVAVVTAEGR